MGTNATRLDVAERLHSAAIHLLRRLAREDPKSGLTAARLSALSVLVFRGPLSLSELAAAERVRPPTMTRIVQSLESEGLARREPASDDRRSVRIFATGKGRRRMEAARRRRVEALVEALGALDDEGVSMLGRAVDVIETLLAEWPPERTRRTIQGR
jgi:DNA-binding MarR family transcriptional regulator